MRFSNYQKAVKYLIHEIPKTSRKVFDDTSALEKNHAIMEALDNPQDLHPAIHIAGTSGKGTICYLVDALLRAHTKRVGMMISPHVYDIRERIQLNGQLVSEKYFVRTLNDVLDATSSAEISLSYFETLTAMAYTTFGTSRLDYQVIETGFGGRLDATNVITRKDKVCILSRIGLDHTESLGDTIEKIAKEKSGIIQPGNHAVVLSQEPEINAVFEARCDEVGAQITWVEQADDYQTTNDRLAEAACKVLARRDGWVFDETLARAVLQQVFIPGRFEKRHFKDHLVILDGAHNPQKLAALASRILKEHKEPATIILSIGERKDIVQCLQQLQPITRRIIATEFFTKERDIPKRPIAPGEIIRQAQQLGIEATAESSPQAAFSHAVRFAEPIIVTGSFYLLSEVDAVF